MQIRDCAPADLPAVINMLERKRDLLATFEPRLWKRAAGSAESTHSYLSGLLTADDNVFLVTDDGDRILGFLLATPIRVPPVYDAGPTAMIDDFEVAAPELWPTVGAALMTAARQRLAQRGIVQFMCISVQRDSGKLQMLADAGLSQHVAIFNGPT
ncbi:MAG TPA: N-acetyltransferase [Devosiaceae bacterium]|nr:N-acetyltransferase [Devosiaceae bacterium]